MERQLPSPLTLGDVQDVEAYVRKIVQTLDVETDDEFEELVADGLELVVQRKSDLKPGRSLTRALHYWLASRLKDRIRVRHRERRRNARAGTSYTIPEPTGLAWEYGGEPIGLPASDQAALISSRAALELFHEEADLRDPRKIGRYKGVPSWAALATGIARDVWATRQEERDLDLPATQPPPFRIDLGPIL